MESGPGDDGEQENGGVMKVGKSSYREQEEG